MAMTSKKEGVEYQFLHRKVDNLTFIDVFSLLIVSKRSNDYRPAPKRLPRNVKEGHGLEISGI